MKTSSSRKDWSGARLVEVSEDIGTDRSMSALADYPDVGRVEEVAGVLRCSKWCVYDLIKHRCPEVNPFGPSNTGDSPLPRRVPRGMKTELQPESPLMSSPSNCAAAWSRAGITWL